MAQTCTLCANHSMYKKRKHGEKKPNTYVGKVRRKAKPHVKKTTLLHMTVLWQVNITLVTILAQAKMATNKTTYLSLCRMETGI